MNRFLALLLTLAALPAHGAGPVIWNGTRSKALTTKGLVLSTGATIDNDGPKNYVANPSGFIGTTGWTTSGTSTIAAVTTGLPRANTTGVGLSIAAGAAADYVQTCFTIDDTDKSKKLLVSWSQAPSSYASSDMSIQVYSFTSASCGGSATKLSLSTDNSSGVSAIANTTDTVKTSFDTNTLSFYGIRFARVTGSSTLVISDLYVGPSVAPMQGAAISEWLNFTPTGTGVSNVTYTGKYRRVGDSMEVSGRATFSGASTAGAFTMTIPTGFTIDTSKILSTTANEQQLGSGVFYDLSALVAYPLTVYYNSTTSIKFRMGSAGGTYLQADTNVDASGIPVVFASGDTLEYDALIPIAEWSGSGTTNIVQNDCEYVFNTSTSDATDTTSFGYGPSGTPVPGALTAARSKRVQWLTPASSTDKIELELSNGGGFVPINSSPILQSPQIQNTATYGVYFAQNSPTQADVVFNQYYQSSGATFGAAGGAWSSISSYRWRLKKCAGGQATGFSKGTSTAMGLVPAGVVAEGVQGLSIQPSAASPTAPTSNTEVQVYIRAGKYVIAYNDAGTPRYKYLDLTGTGVTWVHTTTPP